MPVNTPLPVTEAVAAWDRLLEMPEPVVRAIKDRGPKRRYLMGAEVIINEPDFQHVSVLDRAVAQAKSVGRIVVRSAEGKMTGFGTGSLIGRDLLLTNNHVLPDVATATASTVEFNFLDADGKGDPAGNVDVFQLDPSVFAASPYREARDGGVDGEHLDYTVVGVALRDGTSASERWGRTDIARDDTWFGIGHDVFIVQHPSGAPKHVSLARNEIVHIQPPHVFYYLTDTLPGSSGSAVLDQTWSMVGLHHAAGYYQDADLQIYRANEAVRITSVVADLPPEIRSRIGT